MDHLSESAASGERPLETLTKLLEAQAAVHATRKAAESAEEGLRAFHALLRRTAEWDALRGVDPVERWRRAREADSQPHGQPRR